MTETRLLKHSELVERFFGGWPSFHDAEVESLLLERGGADGPLLELAVHVFVRGPDVDEQGFYRLKAQGLVRLRFSGVELECLEDFNQQNALWDLSIEAEEPMTTDGPALSVLLSSSYGLEASFRCKAAEVASVVAIGPEGV